MKIMLETEHCLLRELLPEDAKGMFELDSDPEVHRYLGNNPIAKLEQAEEVIAFVRKQYLENGIGRWAVIEKASGEFVGWSGLKLEKEAHNDMANYYDIGYRLIRRFWGRGYGYETALACRDYAFRELQVPALYASAHVDNLASNRILQKIGMQFVEVYDYHGLDVNWYELFQVQ